MGSTFYEFPRSAGIRSMRSRAWLAPLLGASAAVSVPEVFALLRPPATRWQPSGLMLLPGLVPHMTEKGGFR